MKKAFLIWCLLLSPVSIIGWVWLLYSPAPTQIQAAPVKEMGAIERDIIRSYVEIKALHSTGSGVVVKVAGDLLVLTCAHVAEDTRQVENGLIIQKTARLLKKKPQVDMEADLVLEGAWSGGIDLALFKPHSLEGLSPAPYSPETEPEVGEDCWYIGTPAGIHARLEKSIISMVDRKIEGHDDVCFGVNGCVWYGNSGGGVFVKREKGYQLAGIVSRVGEDIMNSPKGIGYAVDHFTIERFLTHYRKKKEAK